MGLARRQGMKKAFAALGGAGERPFADDPLPDPCMLDLSVPCQ